MRNHLRVGALIGCALWLLGAGARAQDKGTFLVQDGEFPWYDRMTGASTWALDGVPDSVKGNGPLARQSCSSRALSFPADATSITLGVADKDLVTFAGRYPDARETADELGVKNPAGARIPYHVFVFDNPPAQVGGNLGAGLILLKVTETPLAPGTAPGGVTAPNNNITGAGPTAGTASLPGVASAPGTATTTPGIAPATVATTTPVVLPTKALFHIYILMGQSNMVGRDVRTLAAQVTSPRVLAMDPRGNWVVAHEPMHAGGTGIGPGIPFAIEMLKTADPGVMIGLVPCAVGGTPLSRWVKGADLYQRAVQRALAAAQVGTIDGVLWHQGESDTNNETLADSYQTRLIQMFKDLRTDLNLPDLPIVVGQLGEFLTPAHYKFVDTVRAAIESMPTQLPNVGFADSAGLVDRGDKLHFSADSQMEFGGRYAKAMEALQK